MIEDEEELAEIDTSNIIWTGRRRNAPLDYSSEEALKQAGLDSGSAAVEQEEDDAEFHVSATMFLKGDFTSFTSFADSHYSFTNAHDTHPAGRGHARRMNAISPDFVSSWTHTYIHKSCEVALMLALNRLQIQIHEPSIRALSDVECELH